MEEKKKRGGRRQGAGRPKNEIPVTTVKLSKQASESLAWFSESTGLSKRELVDDLILLYLAEDNKDFAFCPECGRPTCLKALINISADVFTSVCKVCGHEFEVEL